MNDQTNISLNPDHQRALLDVAARAVHDAFVTGGPQVPDEHGYEPALRAPAATFVTLERDDELLGCIGTLEATRPLVIDVAHNALAAAFADPRLPPLSLDDYACMSIKVSVLSKPEPLPVSNHAAVAATVRRGVDGLLLHVGEARSTLLPSVWPKVRDVEEFLDVLWRKASLAPGIWLPGMKVWRYTTDEFGDPGPRPAIAADTTRPFTP
jgi:AmmeMemoRadiSam system protein A